MISPLLAKARTLAGPDRAIDYELYLLAGNVITNEARLSSAARIGHLEAFAPAYTASLDAIVGLIHATWGEGSAIDKYPAEMSLSSVGADPAAGPWRAAVWTGSDETDGRFQQGKTPAIAACCAFLAALNPQETTS